MEFPYAPQNDDELELKVDDIIAVISTELPDKGWWKGEIRGKVGVFPDNFVKMLAPSEGEFSPRIFNRLTDFLSQSHRIFDFGLSSLLSSRVSTSHQCIFPLLIGGNFPTHRL